MRWFALLATVLLSSACVAAETSTVRVAAFRCEVTLPLGHPVYPSFKPLEKAEHPLLAKGIVLEEGSRRYVLCAIDWCVLAGGSRTAFCSKAAAATGTDVSRVTIHAVHQHSAPVVDIDAQTILDGVAGAPAYLDRKFQDEVTDRVAAAVKDSVGRLQPCDQVGVGQAKVERVASSRRLLSPDGKLISRMSSTKSKPQYRELPEGLIDPMLKTITLARQGKPLVRLHYYTTHPQSFYGDPRISYDFPGIAREQLEQEEGVPQVYFTGCAGDVAAGKYNDGTPEARDQLTARIKAGMRASIAATRYEAIGPLAWRVAPVLLPAKTGQQWSEAGLRRTMADPQQALNLRIRAARLLAFEQRKEQPIELCSLQTGHVFLLHLPGEPMVAFQLFAQQQRPDDFVAVAGYGEGGPSYICTDQAYQEGGYEAKASAVAPGSEAAMKAVIRQLLGLPANSSSSPACGRGSG